MTEVQVHRRVQQDLRGIRGRDRKAAAALTELIRGLDRSTRGGVKLEQPGWRAYTSVPGYGVIVSGVGSGTVRVLGVGPLPSLYDKDQLRALAEEAVHRQDKADRDPRVPAPAPRSRIVELDLSNPSGDELPRSR